MLPHRKFLGNTYSQCGEDIVLGHLFAKRQKGFYVDVGAHHPFRYSNTFLFYQKGWRGINIDAFPGSMKPFHRNRPNDINLESGISNKNTNRTFYIFDDPALNTFSNEMALKFKKAGYPIREKLLLPVCTLKEILDNYLPQNQDIDFLNIDVEGCELDVLESNDWSLYRPEIVVVEMHNAYTFEDVAVSRIGQFLGRNGYKIAEKCNISVFFKKTDNAQ